MQKPKFSLGQQVIADFTASQRMGRIMAAQIVSGEWKYGLQLKPSSDSLSYVTNSQVKYFLEKGEWKANS